MIDLSTRLSIAIASLIAKFKTRPDGPYEGLGLVETSIVVNIASQAAAPIQGDVGSALSIPKTTMASAVSRLERKCLIEKVASAVDGRVKVLTLTKAGQALAASLAAAQVQSSQAMLDTLPTDDRETLVRLLERVSEKLRERD